MGLFWDDPIKGRGGAAVRIAPPIPASEWKMPDEFPDLAGQGAIAIDVETYDPDLKTRGPGAHRGGYICGLAIGTQGGLRQYYPIAHQNFPNLDKAKVLSWANEQLSRPGQPKIGANIIYDLEYLEAAGVKVQGPYYDVQVAEPLLDETELSYSLENIARRRIGEGKRDEAMEAWLTQAYGKGNVKANIYRAPPQVVGPYAESDVDLPLRIFEEQQLLLENESLWDLFIMESKLIPMLLAMRQRGVQVNVSKAEELRVKLLARQTAAEKEIKSLSGIAPSIWAADSIAAIFDAVGVPYPRTDKTNAPSFRRGWLEQQLHPVAKAIVEARRLDKFRGTFIEGYVLEGHTNGRIHCSFHQLRGDDRGAVSGRFASSHPNLQNIPIRDPELGLLIRQIFEAEIGSWWKKDWSQIEFRLAVHYAALMKLSGSNRVVQQYMTDPETDYHKVTSALTGLPRNLAKSINFGIVYGLGIPGLCAQLGVEREEGERILFQYHQKLPFVKPLYNKASNQANRVGEIKTILGRKRRFNMFQKFGSNQYFNEREFEENVPESERRGWQRAFTHKALNALLQGSAADIMKKAMVEIWESGVCGVIGAPHLTVHDELDGSCEINPKTEEALAEIHNIMENCVKLQIPLIADHSSGASWGDAK